MKNVFKAFVVLSFLFAVGNAHADTFFKSAYVKWYNFDYQTTVEQNITSYASVSTIPSTEFNSLKRFEMPTLLNWIGDVGAMEHRAVVRKYGTGTYYEYDWDMITLEYDDPDGYERVWQQQDYKSDYVCDIVNRCYRAGEYHVPSLDMRNDKPEARIDFKYSDSQSKFDRIEFNYHEPQM